MASSSQPVDLPRAPAEFEPLDAVWLARPHNPETWPGCLAAAAEQHAAFVERLEAAVRVELIGRDHAWPTDDAWVRDCGAVFTADPTESLLCHDFRFNGWGRKYGDPHDRDDALARRIAAHAGGPLRRHDVVLEGGAVEVNGRGTALLTASCLLSADRNPEMDRPTLEEYLRTHLGVRHAVWLAGGIAGDDTDGHVDQMARFVGPRTIAAARAAEGHPNHEVLERNWRTLQRATDQDGRSFHLVALPSPPPLSYDYPPTRLDAGGRDLLPASYANFLIANHAVFVPLFNRPTDRDAMKTLQRAMPDHEIVGVPADWLAVGQGTLHCLTLPQPTPPSMFRRGRAI